MGNIARVMPAQKPGKSKQDYQTPPEFLDAVRRRFGPITWDLAAHEGNHVCPNWFGPGGTKQDALNPLGFWRDIPGLLWLNPPYADIGLWAMRCTQESKQGARIAFLVPASVGSNWFRDFVFEKSLVLFLNPRLSFDGKHPYPKDCLLAIYGVKAWELRCDIWNWKR